MTKAGASAFVEKEEGVSCLLNTVTALVAARTPKFDPRNSSLQELANRTDLPHLAIIAFGKLERQIRSLFRESYSPEQILSVLLTTPKPPRKELLEKLQGIPSFDRETKLSLGDLIDMLAGLAMAQRHCLPSAKAIHSSADSIVVVRNDLSHGREVDTKKLIVAMMAADDLLKELIKASAK